MAKIKIILKILPWLLLLLALLLWSIGIELPGKGKDKVEVIQSTTILEKVESLGKLELVKYNFKEIYDYASISKGKISGESVLKTYDYAPDLKAILIASGEAVGCIDLTKLQSNDINITGDTLFIQLPNPEQCYHKLDLDKTRVYHFERTGWWSRLFSDDDEMKSVIEKAYRNAEKQIEKSALESGILEQTEKNAKLILKPMLERMSGKIVVLRVRMNSEKIDLK